MPTSVELEVLTVGPPGTHPTSFFCMFFVFDSRFILHIPSEERDNAIRVCFQIELAHWFYLDFYMQNTPGLPQCGIRDFAKADILFITIMTVFHSC